MVHLPPRLFEHVCEWECVWGWVECKVWYRKVVADALSTCISGFFFITRCRPVNKGVSNTDSLVVSKIIPPSFSEHLSLQPTYRPSLSPWYVTVWPRSCPSFLPGWLHCSCFSESHLCRLSVTGSQKPHAQIFLPLLWSNISCGYSS